MKSSGSSMIFPSVSSTATEFSASHSVVALAPSKNKVWVALSNGALEIRDVYTGNVTHYFSPPRRATDAVRPWCLLAVCHEDDHEEMWMGLSTGTLEVHDCENYSLIRQLRKHLSGIYCLSCSAQSVFAGSSDFTVSQWHSVDGQLLRIYNGHSNYVRCLYAEGHSLFTGSDDQTIRVWNSTTGECEKMLTYHQGTGGVSACCRVGATMWSGDSMGFLARWAPNGAPLLSIEALDEGRVQSIELVGSCVYVCYSTGNIFVMNANNGKMLNRFSNGGLSRISSARCVAQINRYFLWTGSGDHTIRSWHHDEHLSMTTERQRVNDMQHFYSSERPYTSKNMEVVDHLQNLRELVTLAEGGEKAIGAALKTKRVEMMSKSAQALILASKLNTSTRDCLALQNECTQLQKVRTEKEKALGALLNKLQNLETAVAALKLASPDVSTTLLTNNTVLPPSVMPTVS